MAKIEDVESGVRTSREIELVGSSVVVDNNDDLLGKPFNNDPKACTQFCAEFRREKAKLKLRPDEILAFGQSPFMSTRSFLIFRVCVATYMVALFWWQWGKMMASNDTGYFWIYLTNWTLTVEAVYFVLAAAVTRAVPALVTPPLLVRATWVLQDVLVPSTLLVFLLFWLLVFPYSRSVDELTCQVHGANWLAMVADMLLAGSPHRPMHLYNALIYALTFLFWTGIHYAAKLTNDDGDRFIYETLDWNGNAMGAAITAVWVVFGAVPLLSILLWWLKYIQTVLKGGKTKYDEWMQQCWKQQGPK